MKTYSVLVMNWGKGYDRYLAGKPKSIMIANWDETEMELTYDDLNRTNPAFAVFYIGTHQHLFTEKLKFAEALCKSLNAHLESVNNLKVSI